jgi:hypothetical protein
LAQVRVSALALQNSGRVVAVQDYGGRFFGSDDGGLSWRTLDSLDIDVQSFYVFTE